MTVQDQGAVAFRLAGNSMQTERGGIKVSVKQLTSGKIEIAIHGLANQTLTYRGARKTKIGQPLIGVSWSGATVKFYLDGELVSEQTAPLN
jgi:hypothetical protein